MKVKQIAIEIEKQAMLTDLHGLSEVSRIVRIQTDLYLDSLFSFKQEWTDEVHHTLYDAAIADKLFSSQVTFESPRPRNL